MPDGALARHVRMWHRPRPSATPSGTEIAPLVTIGVVSFNRLHYLKAMVESARRCIEYPNLQWIIVDGNSVEPGLREYIESLDFFEHRVFEDCSHADAMNRILELARGDCMLLLPEDIQFILRGPWMHDLVELVRARERIGHVTFDVQRRVTITRKFQRAYLQVSRRRIVPLPFMPRPYTRYRTASGREFLGYGWTRPSINGAGIMSFCRTEIWRRLGPWRARPEIAAMEDSGLGAEGDMLRRHWASGRKLEAVMMRFPAAADIITDPRGTKARIRFGNRRYGRYAPPPQGDLYYRIWDDAETAAFERLKPAPAFEDYVQPLGFDLPLDTDGNLLKVSVINEQEPYQMIAPEPRKATSRR